MIYALADCHLSCHSSTNKSMEIFGSAWANYAERIRNFCKDNIREDDILIIPGDISWALQLEEAYEDLLFLHSLPGLKILIRGNHDYWWTTTAKMYKFCEEKGLNSLIFMRYEAIYLPLTEEASLLDFVKPFGRKPAKFQGEELSSETLALKFSKKGDSISQVNTDSKKETAFGLVLASTRGWVIEEDPLFREKDRKIYERETNRLRLALESAKNLKGEADVLLLALHYPPLLRQVEKTKWQSLIEGYEVDMCISGHLHGHKGQKAKIGLYHSCLYLHVAADFLEMEPLLLPLCQRLKY